MNDAIKMVYMRMLIPRRFKRIPHRYRWGNFMLMPMKMHFSGNEITKKYSTEEYYNLNTGKYYDYGTT